jgi:hypothetical protein
LHALAAWCPDAEMNSISPLDFRPDRQAAYGVAFVSRISHGIGHYGAANVEAPPSARLSGRIERPQWKQTMCRGEPSLTCAEEAARHCEHRCRERPFALAPHVVVRGHRLN